MTKKSKKSNKKLIIGICVGVVVLAAIIVAEMRWNASDIFKIYNFRQKSNFLWKIGRIYIL